MGGVVNRPTNALIGEAGPEAVIPLNKFVSMMRESMTPLERTMKDIKNENVALRNDMKSYLGFGGTTSKQFGKETARGLQTVNSGI